MRQAGGVSIIMVSYHTGPALFPAIQQALSQAGLAELVLVDNGNPCDVQAKLRALSSTNPKMILVSGHGNIGFSHGCNLGAGYANGFYLMFLNPDCLLPENALQRMVFALEKHTGAVLAGARLVNVDGTAQRGCWRAIMTPKNAIFEALGLHKTGLVSGLNQHEMLDTISSDASIPVPAISGACMFIRTEDFIRLGGLDEGYFLHVEDMDFCKRVRDSGGVIILIPSVFPTHLLSTSDASSRFVEWQKTKGFIRYFRTHFPLSPLSYIAIVGALLRYAVRGYLRPPKSAERLKTISRKTLLLLSARALPPVMNFQGQTILVTGATSPLGLVLMGRLLAGGARVVAVSRKSALAHPIPNLTWHTADLEAANVNLPEGIDYAIHCAPLWTLSTALPAIKKSGVRKLVAIGSTSIFGKENSGNPQEQMAVSQLRNAEMECTERCKLLVLPFIILRPTMIYGTGLDANISRIARVVKRFGRFAIAGDARGLRQPVHVLDLAEAAMRALLAPSHTQTTYNISGAEALPYRAMVERVFISLQKPVRLVRVSFLPRMLDMAGRVLGNGINGEMARRMNENLVFPHDAATRDFGYAPRGFLAGGIKDINGELQ